MDEVDMDKLIDLVEMANKRVNLSIDGIDVIKLLEDPDSKHILENIQYPKVNDKGINEESLFLKMIALGRGHIIQEMNKVSAETNLNPGPFQVAVDSSNYDMCKTLINLGNSDVNN